MRRSIFFFYLLAFCKTFNAQSFKIRTIAFYNLENLFDTKNNPKTYDDDFTPKGRYHWTETLYYDKISRISKVIYDIGSKKSHAPPDVIGVAEIENAKVLTDIISSPSLKPYGYNYIHRDSPDRRGIDVALIYRKSVFKPNSFDNRKLYLKNSKNKRIYTRDQLVVTGNLDGELFCFIVNHWPSRRGGLKRSNPLRKAAAKLNLSIFDSLKILYPKAKIMSIGDFNDNPNNASFKEVIHTLKIPKKTDAVERNRIYNSMDALYEKGRWSLIYNDNQFLFDQILFNGIVLSKSYESYSFWGVSIYNKPFLITPSGKYKGYPFRSFSNNNYVRGYSDHLPVFVHLIKKL